MIGHDDFGIDGAAGGAIAWPAHLARAGATIVRRPRWQPRMDLVVDLGAQIGSPRWWRGAVTLTAMIAALVDVAPRPTLSDSAVRHMASPIVGKTWADESDGSLPPIAAPMRTSHAPFAAPVAAPASPPATIDGAPVRLIGIVGSGLYRSLLGAGAPPSVAADYLRAIDERIGVGTIAPDDRFDLVFAPIAKPHEGRLLYAGIVHLGRPLSLMRWTIDGREAWLDAAGVGAPAQGFVLPVADARLSSGYGMRFHPILGFSRMHRGVDLAAPLGTPIVAAAEGVVRFAGANSGYGNFVQIQHDGGMGTGYGHMASIVVRPGESVRQGELIGTVGSTGLSTGPHCHFEVYRGGVAIDPLTAPFAATSQLAGEELRSFHATLERLAALPVARG